MGMHTRAAARSVRALLTVALTVLVAGCAQPADSTFPGPGSTQAGSGAVPIAAGPTSAQADTPSEQAQIVCRQEAQGDIGELIGVEATQVGPLQYADHVSTCRYAYPDGAFTLSVQDLPNDITTTDAYDALATKLGRVDVIDLPNADAFSTTDGSVVLRKDTKVMLVDVTRLPAMFGNPPIPRADAARLIMKAVLGCWTGDS